MTSRDDSESQDKIGDHTDQILDTYVNDYNILSAHNEVVKIIKSKGKLLPILKSQLANEEKKIHPYQTYIERRTSLNTIKNIQKQIDNIEQDVTLNNYIRESKPILDSYAIIGPLIKRVKFFSGTQESASGSSGSLNPSGDQAESGRIKLISQYLTIAKKYVKIDVIRVTPTNDLCFNCNFDIKNVAIDDFGICKCPNCDVEREKIYYFQNDHSGDSSQISRTDYLDRDNFRKALERYQGKQPNKLPITLYDELDKYFAKIGRPIGRQIKMSPLNDRGRRADTDIGMMHTALQEIGRSNLYEDTNLICYHYWGWKLPDVSHLEEVIMRDYDKTQEVYHRILDRERSSSLGTQYRLYGHLRNRGWTCYIDEFKIAKMSESIEYHEKMFKIMCDECGDPEIRFTPMI